MARLSTKVGQGGAVSGRQKVAGICGICPAGCGVEVHLLDGKIERLTPLAGITRRASSAPGAWRPKRSSIPPID
jgi:anaerobic selenocysteine-containing dehydrogenase